MAFRPCIDLKQGKVVQIVGGTLRDDGSANVNFVADQPPRFFAKLYQGSGLRGGHVIMLGPGSDLAAFECLEAYPGGMQVGGGINLDNARRYLDAGATHVIVTSYLFDGPVFSWSRLNEIGKLVGKDRLVIDLSCRKDREGRYWVATNRWQTVTDVQLSADLFRQLQPFCDEILVHAADVEGLSAGIDESLVEQLGEWARMPVTYAGGAQRLSDVELVSTLSGGRVDLTIGSALDIFGGTGIKYSEAAALGIRR